MVVGSGREFYRDMSGDLFGPDVTVVVTLRNGESVTRRLPISIASAIVMFNGFDASENVVSARIDYGNLIDSFGGSC